MTPKNICPFEVIEGQAHGLLVAISLNRPRVYGKVVARRLNFTNLTMRLKVGIIIGTFTGVEDKQVEEF